MNCNSTTGNWFLNCMFAFCMLNKLCFYFGFHPLSWQGEFKWAQPFTLVIVCLSTYWSFSVVDLITVKTIVSFCKVFSKMDIQSCRIWPPCIIFQLTHACQFLDMKWGSLRVWLQWSLFLSKFLHHYLWLVGTFGPFLWQKQCFILQTPRSQEQGKLL